MSSHLITYSELTALYGPKAANDLLLAVERNAETPSNVVSICKNLRWRDALTRLDQAA